jgi:uncharacterized repeat protein (TIGR03803 family)
MSKVVQRLDRISRIRRWVITTTLLSALGLVPAVVAQAPSTHFKVLYRFHGRDGQWPTYTLLRDAAGNLYGTTEVGGDLNCPYNPGGGCGTVFQLSTTGQEKVLHKFKGTDGLAPIAGTLSEDSQGNLYGETFYGGDFTCSSLGCGTVFKVDKTGKETMRYAFSGGTDGSAPGQGVILDQIGNIYGTTSDYLSSSYGTVFKIDTTGKKTTLHTFNGINSGDGSLPQGLVADAAGNLYGATAAGGSSCPDVPAAGCGIVFKLDHTGKETVLHRFTGATGDGAAPYCTLVLDKKGNLYGTTSLGGAQDVGTVFKVSTKTRKETILYSFNGNEGSDPTGPVVLDGAGNLYGQSQAGGSFGHGTVFKLTRFGKEKVLHNFSGGKDGNGPFGGLTIDGSGGLYGTTTSGGDLAACTSSGPGCGVVFKITP